MDKVLGVVGGAPPGSSRNDDDIADRLSYRYTTTILIAFALIVSTSQYVGDPIKCWAPAHFTGNHEAYTNHYCWVRNTYYLPFDRHIPKEHEAESRHMITYYQWMPMILLVQALLFYAPVLFWRNMNSRSGLDLNQVIETGELIQQTAQADNREGNLKSMTTMMNRYLGSMHSKHKIGCTVSVKSIIAQTCCRPFGRRRGNYLTFLYLFSKLFFIANVVIQLFALNKFLGHQFSMYGIDVLQELAAGEDWTASNRFPRVTMCDFKVRRLGNIHRYTVQCVLPINLFNEKIYLFVWFWMVFVATVSCLSLVRWTLRAFFARDRRMYIRKHLSVLQKLNRDSDKKAFTTFMDDYLKQDGVFIMRLLGHNTNAITVTEFLGALWDQYRPKELNKLELEEETL